MLPATRSSARCSRSCARPTIPTALKIVNDNQYGNGTAIFTRDGGAARQYQFDVNVGMVGINVPIPVPVAYYSFGGWKASLFGDLHMYGPEGIQFYTRGKVVTARWPDPGTSSRWTSASRGPDSSPARTYIRIYSAAQSRRDPMARRIARPIHLVVAWLLVIGLLVQVFLAGMGVFDDLVEFTTHRDFGYLLTLLPVVLIVTGIVGGFGRWEVIAAAVMFGQFILQSVLVFQRDSMPAIAALHPVNGFLMLLIAIWLAQRCVAPLPGERRASSHPSRRPERARGAGRLGLQATGVGKAEDDAADRARVVVRLGVAGARRRHPARAAPGRRSVIST